MCVSYRRRDGENGRRYKLSWCKKGDEVGGVGAMIKEELCDKVAEVRSVSDRVMTVGVV